MVVVVVLGVVVVVVVVIIVWSVWGGVTGVWSGVTWIVGLVSGVCVTGIWDGFVPWTRISWATGHRYCIHCVLEGVPAMRPLDVP